MGRTDAISLCAALLATLLATACAAEPMAASAAPPSAQDPGAAQPGAIPAQLPEPPDTTPSPWVEHAVEEGMGATCVTVDERNSHGQYFLLIDDYCLGPAPAHLARVILALPAAEIGMSTEQREAGLRSDRLPYTATPGLGRRPDFLLGIGKFWIRSFEAPDPRDTVYLVVPLRCEPAAGDACEYLDGWLAYRLDGEGQPVNVTAEVLPPKPEPTPDEQARYDEHDGSDIVLDASKLRFVPNLRWIMEFDPDNGIADSDPRLFGRMAHFGFLVWNGRRFEAKTLVPREAWPCRPVTTGHRPCSWDAAPDPFVTD